MGRKVIFVGTAALITLGSIGSACSFESSYMTVYGHIACWRFLLGMCLSVCLSACSSVYVPVYLYVSSSVYVSACLSYYLALHLFICTIVRVNVLVSVLHIFALHLSVYMHTDEVRGRQTDRWTEMHIDRQMESENMQYRHKNIYSYNGTDK